MGRQEGDATASERRREPRYDRNLPLRVGHDSTDGLRAESINISTRGLYCKSPRYVAPFAKLRVAVELPFVGGDTATVECEGVVVRVEPEVETVGVKDYRLAVYFLNLEDSCAELIARFVEETH